VVGALALGAAVGLFIASPTAPKPAGAAGALHPHVQMAVLSAGPGVVVLGVEGGF
jgi:hypothetical protein